MEITVKTNKLENVQNGVVALATLSFGDQFKVRGIRVIDGKNGIFAGMPSYKRTGPDGKDTYNDIVKLTDESFRKDFNKAITESYQLGEKRVVMVTEEKDVPDVNVGISLLNEDGRTKALARLHIENVVDVNSVAVRESNDGRLFVSMPSYQTNKTDEKGNPVYQNFCYACNKDFAEKLSNSILERYERSRAYEKANAKGDDKDKPESLENLFDEELFDAMNCPFAEPEEKKDKDMAEKPSMSDILNEAKKKQEQDKPKVNKDKKPKNHEIG